MSDNLFATERAGQIRASECCVIMGTEGFMGKDAFDLYLQLKHGIPFEPKPVQQFGDGDNEEDETDDQRRGHLYEPIALKLAAKDLEKSVDFAEDRDDGIRRFSRRHPEYSFMGAMPDAIFDDGWLGEVKAPRPFVVKKQIEDGIYERHLWQMTMQLACFPEAPGVRFILYECVTCQVYIYSLPRAALKVDRLVSRCVEFWERFIDGDEKFVLDAWVPEPAPRIDPLKPSDFVVMEGTAWKEATRRFAIAKWREKEETKKKDAAKEIIKNAAIAANLSKISVEGHHFSLSEQTRNSLDKRSLKMDYPDLILDDYMKPGKPFVVVSHTPPRGWKGGEQ